MCGSITSWGASTLDETRREALRLALDYCKATGTSESLIVGLAGKFEKYLRSGSEDVA